MWSQYATPQKLGFFALGAMLLTGVGFVGRQYLSRTPQVQLTPVASLQQATTPQASTSAPAASEIVVHVAGAVNKPGLVHMHPTDRVNDAIEKADGATKDADLEQINLAARLVDGTQVYVPKKGQTDAPVQTTEPSYAGGAQDSVYTTKPAASHKSEASAGPVSLNTASAAQLDSLPGVGPATAAKILEYRHEHGGFSSIEELLAVKGIGPKKLEAIRKHVKL
jgi:competence protein ComEA